MNSMKITWICLLLFALAACKEDEIDVFSGEPAVNIAVMLDNGKMDTTRNVGFGFMEEKEITVDFVAKLEGLPVDYDRKLTLTLDGDAIRGTDYELDTEVVLPAKAHEVRIPCHLRFDPSLQYKSRRIVLSTIPDETFVKGFQLSAQIVISDLPNEWVGYDATYLFGICSQAKYRFFYDLMGEYDLAKYDYGSLVIIADYLNQKVLEYNMNPDGWDNKYGAVPMTDENGKEILFMYMPE